MPKILPITRVIIMRVENQEEQAEEEIKKTRKWLLRMVLKMTPKRATRTLKTTVRKQK